MHPFMGRPKKPTPRMEAYNDSKGRLRSRLVPSVPPAVPRVKNGVVRSPKVVPDPATRERFNRKATRAKYLELARQFLKRNPTPSELAARLGVSHDVAVDLLRVHRVQRRIELVDRVLKYFDETQYPDIKRLAGDWKVSVSEIRSAWNMAVRVKQAADALKKRKK